MRMPVLIALVAWLLPLAAEAVAAPRPVPGQGLPGHGRVVLDGSRGAGLWLAQGRAWRHQRDQERARDAYRSGDVLPLSRILSRVRRQFPGKLLDASLTRRGNAYVYVIKLLDSGNRVRLVQVDARSGRILSAR